MRSSEREGRVTVWGIKNGVLTSLLWWVPVISAGIVVWRCA